MSSRSETSHDVELPATAGAGHILDIGNLLDARQVRGQRAAVGATLLDPVSALGGISRFLAGEALGLDLLGLLEAEQ